MKKLLKLLTVILALTLSLGLFTACGDNEPQHEHNYATLKYSASRHWYECSCGEAISLAFHKGGEATETAKAVCEVCNQEYGETLSHVHDFSKEVVSELYLKESATCVSKAVYYYSCACEAKGYTTFEYGELLEHTYESVVTAPTCEEEGYTTYTCECGDSYVDNKVDALGHKYVPVVTAPTCEAKGFTTYTCSVCEDSYVGDEVAALGHKYTATANGDGTHTKVCANDETHVVTEDCNGGQATCLEKAVCADCNAEYGETGHNYEAVVTAPTCDEDGYTTYTCGTCQDTYVDDIVPAGHVYYTSIVPATCEKEGEVYFVCACGDKYFSSYIEKLPHAYGAWISNNNGTASQMCYNGCKHTINATVVDGKVLYSAADKALDYASLKKALANFDVEISSIDDVRYNNNGDLVAELELEVIISGTGANRTVDTAQVVVFELDGAYYYLEEVYAYTKLIDEASDLEHFRYDYANDKQAPQNDGYYLVLNDIDASGYKMQEHDFVLRKTDKAGNVLDEPQIYPGSDDKNAGLSGVFNGNGYTISNLTAVRNGIFGWINEGATIKNIAFTNVVLTGSYPTLFAHGLDSTIAVPTLISNVYVSVKSMAAESGVLVNNGTSIHGTKFENIVIDWSNFGETELGWLNKTGGRFSTVSEMTVNAGTGAYKDMFKGIYTITSSPVVALRTGSNAITAITVAGNKVQLNEDGSYTVLDENLKAILEANKNYKLTNKNVNDGIKSYSSYAEMAADAEANAESVAAFNSKCWTIVNGIPYWKSLYADTVELVVTDSEGNKVDGEIIIKDNTTEYTINLADASHNLDVEIVVPEGVVLEGNTIKLANKPTSIGVYEIEISATVNGFVFNETLVINYSNAEEVAGEVLYSKYDGALDMVSFNKALAASGKETLDESDITGYIVGGVESDALDLEVIVSGKLQTRVVDTAQQVTVKVGEIAYIINVYAYTRLIDELSDLDWISRERELQADGSYLYDTYDGYYLMTKNLSGKGLGEDGANYTLAGGQGSGVDKTGLTGVFDGNGFVISDVIMQCKGLFVRVQAGVVKNVAFDNCEISGYYPTVLAHAFTNKDINGDGAKDIPLLKNVYIGNTIVNLNYTQSGREAGLISQNNFYSYAENVVVNHTMTQAQKDNIASKRFSIFFSQYYHASGAHNNSGMNSFYKNFYVVSDAPIAYGKHATSVTWSHFLLDNDMLTLNSETNCYELKEPTKFSVIQGLLNGWNTSNSVTADTVMAIDRVSSIKQYISYADMAAAKNDTTAFENDCWTIVNGVPYWKELYKVTYNVQVKDGDDVVEGDIELLDNTTELSLDLLDMGGNVIESTITAPEGITVSGNKVRLTNIPTSEETYEITLSAVVNGATIERVVVIKTQDYTKRIEAVLKNAEGEVVTNVLLEDADTVLTLDLVDGETALANTVIDAPEGVVVDGNTIKLANNPTSVGSHEIKISVDLGGVVIERYVTINYTNEKVIGGNVFYSADDKALDLTTLNKALVAAGVEIESLDEIDGYIVNGEMVEELELEVIISNNTSANYGRNRSVDVAQEVIASIGGKNYVMTNVYAYTKVIDEAKDFNYFALKDPYEDDIEGNEADPTFNEKDGYFVLSKNIDATNFDIQAHRFTRSYNATKDEWTDDPIFPGNGYNTDIGFRGVLDGNGYTVNNLTAKSCGIFASMTGAVIKNIAFTNVTITGYYGCLFAKNYLRGKDYNNGFNNYEGFYQNVYVSVKSVNYTGSNSAIGIFVQAVTPNAVHYENVVADFLNVDETTQSKIDAGKQFVMIGSSTASMASATYTYKNCYVITTAPVLQLAKMPGFAENQVEYTLEKGKVTAVGNVIDTKVTDILGRCGKTLSVDYVIVGLRAYDDYAAMKDANNNYSSFSTDYWTIKNGVPTWNTAA